MCPSIMEARLRSQGRRKMRPEYVPERSRSTGREPTVAQVSGVHGLVLLSAAAAAAAAAAPGRGGVAVTCVHAVLGMGRGRGLGRSITVPNSSLGTSGTLVWEVFEGCNPPLCGQLGKVLPTSDCFCSKGSPQPLLSSNPPVHWLTNPCLSCVRKLFSNPPLIRATGQGFPNPNYLFVRRACSNPPLFSTPVPVIPKD